MHRRYVYDDSVRPGKLIVIVQGDEKAVDDYLRMKYDGGKYGYSKKLRRKDYAPRVTVINDNLCGYEIVD